MIRNLDNALIIHLASGVIDWTLWLWLFRLNVDVFDHHDVGLVLVGQASVVLAHD